MTELGDAELYEFLSSGPLGETGHQLANYGWTDLCKQKKRI